MSVQIPVGGTSLPTQAVGGVTIPIGSILPVPQFGATREDRIVRALAAAAALQDPSDALSLAQQAIQDPSAVAANVIDRTKLDPVLAQVAGAIGQTDLPQANSEQRAAARAAGADATLVAVAQAALITDTTNGSTTEAREWVATIDPVLLDRSARAGLRQRNLNLVPQTTTSAANTRLDVIEQRLKALEDKQKAAITPARKS